MIQAADWGTPPWEITGEKITRWRQLVWRYRHQLYIKEFGDRQQRHMEELQMRASNG